MYVLKLTTSKSQESHSKTLDYSDTLNTLRIVDQ